MYDPRAPAAVEFTYPDYSEAGVRYGLILLGTLIIFIPMTRDKPGASLIAALSPA